MESLGQPASGSLTRLADSPWPRLEVGQYAHVSVRGETPWTWRVVKVTPNEDGSETYDLVPWSSPA